MMQFNDIANERYKDLNNNDSDKVIDSKPSLVKRESRTDSQNEEIATYLMEKLGAQNWEPYLAVAYSGVPRDSINKHLATASEVGRYPAKLFMHLIKREPAWLSYKRKKQEIEDELLNP